jgi:hypothetical protein
VINVIIPCIGSRQADLDACLAYMGKDPEIEVTVLTDRNDPVEQAPEPNTYSVRYRPDELSLSKWFNAGTALAEYDYDNIMWCESDVRIQASDIIRLRGFSDAYNYSMVGPDFHSVLGPSDHPINHTVPGPVDWRQQIVQCFLLGRNLHKYVRMDTRFAWWFEVNDLEWRMRSERNGTALCPVPAEHIGLTSGPGGDHRTPEQVSASERGRKIFKAKWGYDQTHL